MLTPRPMPYIHRIRTESHGHLPDFDVKVPGRGHGRPAHLLLTGPNGSGKTTLVRELGARVLSGRDRRLSRGLEVTFAPGWDPKGLKRGTEIALYRPALFQPVVDASSGPTEEKAAAYEPTIQVGNQVLQYLVNRKTQQAFALADGDQAVARELGAWFDQFERSLATLFGVEALKLEFDRQRFDFSVRLPGRPAFSLTHMAHGHAAVLTLVGDLMIRMSAAKLVSGQDQDPLGVVVIDELETHLHLKLQEIILPFLQDTFPTLQFVVATHSPAIVASAKDAYVLDLRNCELRSTEDFRGVRYGTVMTSHFGISSDFDLETTRRLEELKRLRRQATRSAGEEQRLRDLAQELSRTSHSAALEVWTQVQEELLTSAAQEGDD